MSLQALRARKTAVSNVGKITKAMEIVSATKMRKSQEVALRTRSYAIAALELLRTVTHLESYPPGTPTENQQGKKTKDKKTLIVLIASDRGLTGAFNAQVLRRAEKYIKNTKGAVEILAVGKKAVQCAEKNSHILVSSFSNLGDVVAYEEVLPLADVVIRGFEDGRWERVVTVSTHFRTTLKQEVLVREILPTRPEKIQETIEAILPEHGRFSEHDTQEAELVHEQKTEYILEPSREGIIRTLIPYLLRMQIYHIMLEANASEHSARRVAMKTATDNAHELEAQLILSYNKARQASITQEIIEITSTREALGA